MKIVSLYSNVNSINGVKYFSQNKKDKNISFGIANSGKLKILFSYGLPCMYSGIEMIDPKKIQNHLKNQNFNKPMRDIIKIFSPYEKSMTDIEGKVWQIIKGYTQENSDMDLTLKEVFQKYSPIFNKRILKKQNPIFQKLHEMSSELPDKYKYKFNLFMDETQDKINGKSVVQKFSAKEFKYKFLKVINDINENKNIKANKVLKKLIEVSNNIVSNKSSKTNERNKQIVLFMEKILNKSVLKNNEQLRNLINSSKSKLNNEKMIVQFTRKSFIYDLSKFLEDLPDKELKDRFLNLAEELPTSRNNVAAYILKFKNEPSEKIAYRLLWPFMASVEHIYPKSLGGADAMSNFGGACTRENSERQSIDFTVQMKRRPQTKMNCQRYVNRLIELFKKGVFQKHNINPNYIENFKMTIKKCSKGSLLLDTSKLKSPQI